MHRCSHWRSQVEFFFSACVMSRIRVEPPTSLAELWDLFDTMLFAEGWQAPQRLPKRLLLWRSPYLFMGSP